MRWRIQKLLTFGGVCFSSSPSISFSSSSSSFSSSVPPHLWLKIIGGFQRGWGAPWNAWVRGLHVGFALVLCWCITNDNTICNSKQTIKHRRSFERVYRIMLKSDSSYAGTVDIITLYVTQRNHEDQKNIEQCKEFVRSGFSKKIIRRFIAIDFLGMPGTTFIKA